MPINPFLLTIEPLIFTFCFTIEGYNVFVIMEFFPHIDVMMAKSTIDLPDQDTQGIPEVNTFLNLFIHWLQNFKYNFTLPLENLFFLYYQNWTTTILINYYEVFLLGCCYFVKVQPLFLAWIGLSPHQKPLGIISRAHCWVLVGFPIFYSKASISPSTTSCWLQIFFFFSSLAL